MNQSDLLDSVVIGLGEAARGLFSVLRNLYPVVSVSTTFPLAEANKYWPSEGRFSLESFAP